MKRTRSISSHVRPASSRVVMLAIGLLLAPSVGFAAEFASADVQESTSPQTYPNPTFAVVPGPVLNSSITAPQAGMCVIDGAKGGQIKVGRFTLDIPAGAFAGTSTVRVSVPNASVLQCSLDILPAIDRFRSPVRLTIDGSGCDANRVAGWKLVYFDPGLGKWVAEPSSIASPASRSLSARLWHFSLWGVVQGKAGW